MARHKIIFSFWYENFTHTHISPHLFAFQSLTCPARWHSRTSPSNLSIAFWAMRWHCSSRRTRIALCWFHRAAALCSSMAMDAGAEVDGGGWEIRSAKNWNEGELNFLLISIEISLWEQTGRCSKAILSTVNTYNRIVVTFLSAFAIVTAH